MATVLQTIADIRKRADMVNSEFCTNTELLTYAQDSYRELYDVLVQKYGEDYFATTPTEITTDGTNDRFSLAGITGGVYKLLGVDLKLGTNEWTSLRPFNFAERNQNTLGNVRGNVSNLRYRLIGTSLWLTPLPSANQIVRVWCVPGLVVPTADADSFTTPANSGWQEFIVISAAIKALNKEESDVSVLMAEKAGMLARIESAAANRDAGSPATVADVYADTSWDY